MKTYDHRPINWQTLAKRYWKENTFQNPQTGRPGLRLMAQVRFWENWQKALLNFKENGNK